MARERILTGKTIKLKAGCGNVFTTINFNKDNKPFEVFVRLGKAGGCPSSQTEALGRLISMLLQNGVEPEDIIKHLKGISCYKPFGLNENKILSCADAVAKAIEEACGIVVEIPQNIKDKINGGKRNE